MGTRRKALIALACAALVSTALSLLLYPAREPRYKGFPLRHWVGVAAQHSDSEQAREAIRHIGTNAIPFLLEWIQYDLPPWRFEVGMALEKHDLPRLRRWVMRRWDLANEAALGFTALGVQAKAALPQLSLLARSSTRPDSTWRFIAALIAVGPEGIPPLMTIATNPLSSYRKEAIDAIATFRTNAVGVIPALLPCLRDTNDLVAVHTVIAILRIKPPPQTVAGALREVLHDDRPLLLRIVGAQALGELGGPTPETLSALTAALKDPDLVVREKAAVSILLLVPETLTNTTISAELQKLVSSSREAIYPLVKALTNAEPAIRAHATNYLERLSPEHLTNLLRDWVAP